MLEYCIGRRLSKKMKTHAAVQYSWYCIQPREFLKKIKLITPPVATVLLQQYCCISTVVIVLLQQYRCNSTVLLQQYCCHSTVATVLLQQYCCNNTVATVLLQQYCCNSTVATVLLQQYCIIYHKKCIDHKHTFFPTK